MRIATFNLENLFTRPSAMNHETDTAGREAIEDQAELSAIVRKDIYTPADQARLVELIVKYKFHYRNPPKKPIIFQKIRGQLFRNPKNKPVEIVASGRADWTGWFELRKEDIAWEAIYNTGRVVYETQPDILVVVEVENRPTLERFNVQVLEAEFGMRYPHYMVIDGNDDRGIDVGIMSRYPIRNMLSHVDDVDSVTGYHLFSRDCPEFEIDLGGGSTLIVLANHFKSKRNGDDGASTARRARQAARALTYANSALARSSMVVLAGDFNDTPDSDPIRPLCSSTLFSDVMKHPDYPADRPGTFGTGLASGKLDYLMLSSALWSQLTGVGLERRGSYHPGTWTPFDTVTSKKNEASDHHLVYADIML
jgi:endonuclease/exonuclease/phosphatase family metal-dependent hydrolase